MFNTYVRDKFEKAGDYRFYFGEKNNFVNFDTLIHLYVFFQLKSKGFSYKKIFDLYKTASEDQDTPFPFSEDLRIYTESKNFILSKDGNYYTADEKRQYYFNEIIEPLSNKMEYSESGILKFYPLGKNKTVVIDPKVQLGAPTIDGTRINAKTIFKLHEAGENHNVISNIYNISEKQINDAVEYYSKAA